MADRNLRVKCGSSPRPYCVSRYQNDSEKRIKRVAISRSLQDGGGDLFDALGGGGQPADAGARIMLSASLTSMRQFSRLA
jgi:hypothetical protein